jgi:hypothetical protein
MRLVRDVGRAEHASTEQLSALLDGRSEPDEQQFLAGHVGGCDVCSNELSGLRSVQSLLRSMPVRLPPRSFTLSIESVAAPPRRFRRLIPLTRVVGTVAAVLCVVLFSVDAIQTGYDAPMSPSSGGTAMHLNPLGTFETTGPVDAQGDVRKAAASRSAAEAGPADVTSKVPNAPAASAPAQSAAKPAVAQAPGGTSSAEAARSAAPAPGTGPTVAAFAPGQPAVAPTVRIALTPGQAATDALQRPAGAPAATSPWWSPIRLWSLGLALVAAGLLVVSMVLSRIARKPAGPRDEWTGI